MPMRFFPGSDERRRADRCLAATDADPPPPDQDAKVSKTEVKKPGKQPAGPKRGNPRSSMPPEASTTSAPETIGNFPPRSSRSSCRAGRAHRKSIDAAPLDSKAKPPTSCVRRWRRSLIQRQAAQNVRSRVRSAPSGDHRSGCVATLLVDRSVMPDGLLYRFWQGRSIRPLEGRPATTGAA